MKSWARLMQACGGASAAILGLVTVLVSGYAEMPLHRAVDAQGINFLSKPFSLAELMDAIAEVILSNSEK